MAHRSGGGLLLAGGIVTFIGACIVAFKVLRLPEYWAPLMVGVRLLLMGVTRRMSGAGSPKSRP